MASIVDYVIVSFLGLLVGASELVSRYRDAPWVAVRNPASATYIAVNVLAAVGALGLLRVFNAGFGLQNELQERAAQVLVAGFSAVALLRTSFFVVRVGGRDIGVGPATLLQVLLFATDRDVDRRRAEKRATAVTEALRGLSYEDVGEALPTYCLTLMQNVPDSEIAEVRRQLDLVGRSGMSGPLKLKAVGLVLMNVVGQRVLEAAAKTARSRLLQQGVLGEVYPELYKAICGVEASEQRQLDVLGITLHTAWPRVKAWIQEPGCRMAGWTIRLRVVDPDILGGHEVWFDARWAEEVRIALEDVRRFADYHRQDLDRLGITLSISTYRLLPFVHGFRTGAGDYFLSLARWDPTTGELGRPYETYEHLLANDRSDRVQQYKEIFDNWLDRAKQDATFQDTDLSNIVADETLAEHGRTEGQTKVVAGHPGGTPLAAQAARVTELAKAGNDRD